MTKPTVSQERLRSLLIYDPDTGNFTWRVRRGCRSPGSPWGCTDGAGYVLGMIDKRFYRGHQLAYIYMTGDLPGGHIDHVNGAKDDNRWSNLRACQPSENASNHADMHSKNTSGYRGVCKGKGSKWFAQIQINGRHHHLGTHPTKEDAALAYDRAAIKAKGEFATLNFPRQTSL